MPEQLIAGKRRATGSRVIDEIKNRNLRTMKFEEGENLRRIFYVSGENMNAMSGLAGPITPGLFMCLLVMSPMMEV